MHVIHCRRCDSVCEKAEVALLNAKNMVCILHTLCTLLIVEADVIHSHRIVDDFVVGKQLKLNAQFFILLLRILNSLLIAVIVWLNL